MKTSHIYMWVSSCTIAYMLVWGKAVGQTQEKGSDMVQSIICSVWWWLESVDDVWKCVGPHKILFRISFDPHKLTWYIYMINDDSLILFANICMIWFDSESMEQVQGENML